MSYRLLKFFLEELEILLRKGTAPSKFLKDLEEAKPLVELRTAFPSSGDHPRRSALV